MVVTSSQMLAAEQAVIRAGVSAEALMEEASQGIWEVIQGLEMPPGTAIVYLGKGNNAGDALCVARRLSECGWKIFARCVTPVGEFKELPAKHWRALEGKIMPVTGVEAVAHERGRLLILDGILGIGASVVPLKGAYADAVREMNSLRRARHAITVAIDVPTGLGAGEVRVEADLTITIGHPKTFLLEDDAAGSVGRIAIVPLKELSHARGDPSQRVLSARNLLASLPCRSFEFHKGKAGRVGIVAGSRGFLGAAALAAAGALRGGAGLTTLYAKEEVYSQVASLVPPEIMVKPVRDYREVLDDPLDVLAAGPGLGMQHEEEVMTILSRSEIPIVVDADALNMIARRGFDAIKSAAAPQLLTPHPGEMTRLATHHPEWSGMGRREIARDFIAKYPRASLLLKGARTLIAGAGQPISFNSTGNPGMATGGMGDVLTGLCAALAAQGVSLYSAACLGTWLSGRAAECAISRGGASQESLSAGQVLQFLGCAFEDLKRLVY